MLLEGKQEEPNTPSRRIARITYGHWRIVKQQVILKEKLVLTIGMVRKKFRLLTVDGLSFSIDPLISIRNLRKKIRRV